MNLILEEIAKCKGMLFFYEFILLLKCLLYILWVDV